MVLYVMGEKEFSGHNIIPEKVVISHKEYERHEIAVRSVYNFLYKS